MSGRQWAIAKPVETDIDTQSLGLLLLWWSWRSCFWGSGDVYRVKSWHGSLTSSRHGKANWPFLYLNRLWTSTSLALGSSWSKIGTSWMLSNITDYPLTLKKNMVILFKSNACLNITLAFQCLRLIHDDRCIAYRLRMYQTPVSAPASQEPDRSHAVRYRAITYTAWSENTV